MTGPSGGGFDWYEKNTAGSANVEGAFITTGMLVSYLRLPMFEDSPDTDVGPFLSP